MAVHDFPSGVTLDGDPGNAAGPLDGSGLLPTSQLPPLAIGEIHVVASEAAMLALTAQRGDVAKRTDTGVSYWLSTDDPTQVANWVSVAALTIAGVTGLQAALDAKAPTASPTLTGPVTVEDWAQFGSGGAAGVIQNDSGNLSVRGNDTLELKSTAESVDIYTNDVLRLRVGNDGSATVDSTFAASLAAALGAGAPTGTMAMWGTGTPPTGYLVCDGSAVSRSTYATLFALIGTTFGAGNGSTTFNLPDLRGRTPIGAGTGSGLTARTLAGTVGAETHTLTGAESGLPAHSHTTANKGAGTGPGNQPYPAHYSTDNGWAGSSTSTEGPTSASNAHNNMQPSLVVHFIIKT